MKILLLGEFSGFHKNLKDGLLGLGHEVVVASSGDGWKAIEKDIDIGSDKKGVLRKLHLMYKVFVNLNRLKGFDIVQFISPLQFTRYFGFNYLVVKFLLTFNDKVFLVGAGALRQSSITADFLEAGFKYPQHYFENKKISPDMWSQTKSGRKYNEWFFDKINGYIPIMYEYAEGYRRVGCKKLLNTIPIPINLDEVKYRDNIVQGKLVVFHGLNREGVKGTSLIKEAMNQLQKKYPNEVECIIDGKMPLNEYLSFLERVNVVVDQIYSVSIGVNGVYNLALGKVVVGGGEDEFLKEHNIACSPLIPVSDSVDDIFNKLERLVLNRHDILELGKSSREFAETLYDYKKVAKAFVNTWTLN